MKKAANGFTLTEVLMVVVIIGVLACLIIPRYTASTESAYASQATGTLGAMRQAELAYNLETGSYMTLVVGNDAVWTSVGMANPNDSQTNWSFVTDGNGNGTATRLGGNASVLNTTITLSLQNATWGGTNPFVPSN